MARSSLIPGFRFHPTDVELVMYYLKRKLLGKKIIVKAVAEVNIYNFSPWDLPDKSALKGGDLEWYFFCPKARKYTSGGRSNRSTETGFWKATGKDRKVSYNQRTVATIKTLVFHVGHTGKGQRTDWVMHEYKMEDQTLANTGIVQDMYVLCKVFQKSGAGPKIGAHYGAPFNEEEWGDDLAGCIDSQVVAGLVGTSNTMYNQQKGLDTMNMTEPSSSICKFSANQLTNTLNDKQKGPAAISITEPGSSAITFSTELTNTLIDKQKNSAATNTAEPQTTYGDFMFFDDDVIFWDELDVIMGSKEPGAVNAEKVEGMVKSNEEDRIYDELVNLIDLEELNKIEFKTDGADYKLDNLLTLDDIDSKTHGADYTLDKLITLDDLDVDLGGFYGD